MFLVNLNRLSMSGHTVLPNWECEYISRCVFVCVRSWRGCMRRILLRMKTLRRRKCCIWAVYGLFSSPTRGNEPCWQSARLGLSSLTGESACSESLSYGVRKIPTTAQKCLLKWWVHGFILFCVEKSCFSQTRKQIKEWPVSFRDSNQRNAVLLN